MQRLRNRGERDRERERDMRRSSGLRAGSRRDRDRFVPALVFITLHSLIGIVPNLFTAWYLLFQRL